MNAKWLWLAPFVALALIVAGCQTQQPNIRPDDQREVFNSPPANLNNSYPKQAFNDDGNKRLGLDGSNGIMPARGAVGGPNMVGPANFGGPLR